MSDLLQALTDAVTTFIADNGTSAVFVLMLLESACIPVPSEVIMLYAGYLVSIDEMTLAQAIVAGVAGNVVGSCLTWWVGAAGGRPLVERHGHYIHVTPARLAWADHWFERYGEIVVLVSRCLPIIRTFISLPAGVARMPFWRFTLYTTIGCIPWVTMLALLGVWVGDSWDDLHHQLEYFTYAVIAACVLGVGYLVLRQRRTA